MYGSFIIMGCLQTKLEKAPKRGSSKKKSLKEDSSTSYSWDKKEKIDPKDYTISNLKGETVGRIPGSVNGLQFIIENCEESNIFLLDHTNSITVDNCVSCNIVLGPSKNSVFLRDCENCRFVCAAQQFRVRDCKQVDVFLCCATQPVIESSRDIRFGCYSYHYSNLEEQFKEAGLSVFNNCWYKIHDFTPVDDDPNWTLLPLDARVEDFLPFPTTDELSSLNISTEPPICLVPQIEGPHKIHSKESALVVFFPDGQSCSRASNFIREVQYPLIRTKEITLHQSQAEQVFGTSSYNSAIQCGPVIALHYNGDGCITACENTAMAIATDTGSTGLVYVSTNKRIATRQVEDFFNLTDIHM